jgi:hypothetical protein
MHRPKDALSGWTYLIEDIRIGRRSKSDNRWWTLRNKDLILAHSKKSVSKEEVDADFKKWIKKTTPTQNTPNQPTQRVYYDKRHIEYVKAYLGVKGVLDWDEWKQRETGKKGKVSDQDYLRFMNKEGAASTGTRRKLQTRLAEKNIKTEDDAGI